MADESSSGRTSEMDSPIFTRQWTLVAAVTATFLVMLDSTAVMMALPGLGAELAADFSGQQWVVAAHAVPLAAFLLTGGALADRFGHRSAFRLGALLFTGGSVAAGAAGTVLVLLVARGVQGIGSAFLLATASTLAAHEFPGSARARARRLLPTAAGLGLALGPVVGGLLAEADWRLVFLSVLPAGVMLQAIGKVRLREVRPTTPTSVDWQGFALFSGCVALVVLGLLRGQSLGWTSTPVLAMFTGATFLLFLFLLTQRARADRAVIELALFDNRTFLGVSLATFVSGAIGLAVLFLETLHLRHALGHSPLEAGLRLLPFTVVLIGTVIIARRVGRRIEPGVVVGASTLLVTIGAWLVTAVDPDSTWVALIPSMIASGVGIGMGIAVRETLAVRAVELVKTGAATRINATCHHLGAVAGVAAFGALFHYRAVGGSVAGPSGDDLPLAVTEAVSATSVASLHLVALVCALVGSIAALVAFTCIRRRDLRDHRPN